MPRFQLLIREFGKTPRVVPVPATAVVGRSRKADIVIEDEECGREQFKLSLVGATVVIEGIGKTNKTTVDGSTLGPGERATVTTGATIKVGRSTIFVQTGDVTESNAPRPGPMDATLVARGPTSPEPMSPQAAEPPQRQEMTGNFVGPSNTLDMPRPVPGGASPGATAAAGAAEPADGFDQTINVKGFRPGQPMGPGAGAAVPPAAKPPAAVPPPAAPPLAAPAAAGDEDFGQTINVKGFRPGQPMGQSMAPGMAPGAPATPPKPKPPMPPAPAPPAAPPSSSGDDFGQTMNVKGFRPGRPDAPPTPTPPPPSAPRTTANMPRIPPGAAPPGAVPPGAAPLPSPLPQPLPKPAPAVPPAAASAPVPPPETPSAPPKSQPKTTVYVDVAAMQAPTGEAGVAPADIESRLHAAMPRVFVKSAGLKRRVRLMKTRCKVGRAETADVLLPNESVSELHAEIEFDGAAWLVRDCGSTNGTFVDGTVLRGQSQAIARNSLLGFGNLRGLFFCNDAARAAADQRAEERALRLLIAAGRLTREVGAQVRTLASRDKNQSIAEVLLLETPLEPGDWVNALTAAKQRVSLWDRIRGLFRRTPRPPGAAPR